VSDFTEVVALEHEVFAKDIKSYTLSNDLDKYPDGAVTMLASDEKLDRYRDIIMTDGWKWNKNYIPLLLNHDVSQILGLNKDPEIKNKQLWLTGIFNPIIYSYDLPQVVREWCKRKCIQGVSVGFRSIKRVWSDENSGYIFIEQLLLENSIVTIPANPRAKIVDVKGLHTPDGPDKVIHSIKSRLDDITKRIDEFDKKSVKSDSTEDAYILVLKQEIADLKALSAKWEDAYKKLAEKHIADMTKNISAIDAIGNYIQR